MIVYIVFEPLATTDRAKAEEAVGEGWIDQVEVES